MAAREAPACLRQIASRRKARLHPSPLGRTADFPSGWACRDRLQWRQNLIRPIALNRSKEDQETVQWTVSPTNALFAGHDDGGKAWGRIASLIETAKINGVEPFAYLKATLEAIANGHPKSRIDELLPWNFKPSS